MNHPDPEAGAWSASLEWVADAVAVVRVHPGPAGTFGDPYEWACTVVATRRGTAAELKGVVGCPSLGQVRALEAELSRAGFTHRIHERRKPGEPARIVRRPL